LAEVITRRDPTNEKKGKPMSAVIQEINARAKQAQEAEAVAAAERAAKKAARAGEFVNVRNIRPASPNGTTPAGSFVFPPTETHDGFEIQPGDNLIDVSLLTAAVRNQLADWINAGWIEVLPASSVEPARAREAVIPVWRGKGAA
jgi:hypothetical protein